MVLSEEVCTAGVYYDFSYNWWLDSIGTRYDLENKDKVAALPLLMFTHTLCSKYVFF